MIPSIGRTVHYRLNEHDERTINRRRSDADASQVPSPGLVFHCGNVVRAGDVYPLVITRVWADPANEQTAINGQVLLDGSDTLWVTSRVQGDYHGQWFAPPRV